MSKLPGVIPTRSRGDAGAASPETRPHAPTLKLSLQRLEDINAAEGSDERVPHRHPYHCELMWVESGETSCFVEGRVYRLRAGDLYALPAGVVHAVGATEAMRGYVLHCAPELLARTPTELLTRVRRGNFGDDLETAASLGRIWTELATEYAQVRPGRGAAIAALLRLLGVHVRRLDLRPADLADRPQPVSLAFRELLDAQFARERNPAAYAAQLGLTADQLRLRVREETGASPREHIDRRVVLEAERLLAFTQLSIGDIAQRLGFAEVNYFWRYFRKHTGRTPGDFRDGLRDDFTNAGAPGLELPF